jgi:lipid-A-disaccharide synthase
MMNTVVIISGESSGELYGSLLAKAMKKKHPNIRIMGVGGKRMREAGVEIISNISDAFGLVEALSAYRKIKNAFQHSVKTLKECKPEVLVLIDYPDFNLKLAKVAKELGIKILYYVSPQVWAWRKGRVRKIASLVDRMAVILPFEEKIYRDAGLPCEFVGHPILEEIDSTLETINTRQHAAGENQALFGVSQIMHDLEVRKHLKASLGIDPNKSLLSLLPGSRPHEMKRLFPLMLNLVRQLKKDPEIQLERDYQICIPLAPNTDEEKYHLSLNALKNEGARIKKGESVKILAASDLAVVASGTATLQTAFLGIPMVVVYRLSPTTFFLGKRIVKVKHISLVNILAGKEVVRELLQKEANPGEVIKELKKIIFDQNYREKMINAYRFIREPFTGKRASERVAEMVIEIAGWKVKS